MFRHEGGVGIESASVVSKHEMEGSCWTQRPPVSCLDVMEGRGWSKVGRKMGMGGTASESVDN